MINDQNPFPHDPDRYAIWEMLVTRDIQAFVTQDWNRVAQDFLEEEFMGIDARNRENPDFWSLKYATLDDYRQEWLNQAKAIGETAWENNLEEAIYEATILRDIEINKDVALAHKKFDGILMSVQGQKTELNWQTLYRCRNVNGHWRIVGFTGYMPYVPSTRQSTMAIIRKPHSASQHVTAGPYSPVLEIQADKLVVISGQAAINEKGQVVGDTIEEQTNYTLMNCKKQLHSAGVTLNDVFKVNVYLTDLDLWPRFNEVYKTYFSNPMPVRTAIGCDLLMTLLVEIDLWAVKK